MNHSFNVAVATEYGMLEAVLFENISYWVEKNKANDVHFYDGCYWTYNSARAFAEMFPYASSRTISRALHHLCDEGLVVTGDYNSSPYDKTLWYTLTAKGQDIMQNGIDSKADCPDGKTDCPDGKTDCLTDKTDCPIEVSEMSNRSTRNGEPIPDINTYINTNNNLTVSNDTVCRTGVRRVAAQWNSLSAYGIKSVSGIRSGTKRYDMLNARIHSYGLDKVLEAVGNIKNSAFLCGDNRKGWVITFDWFVRPNNFIKVLEGNYDGSAPKARPDTGQQDIGRSGYSLELLERLSGGGEGYGQA